MLAVITTVPTIAMPAMPSPILGAPDSQASNRLSGSQMTAARVTMMPSSDDEHPLKIAGSTFSRSARMFLALDITRQMMPAASVSR